MQRKSITRIAIFGASTTAGFVDTSGKGGWVGRLKRDFESGDYTDRYVYNLGIDGDSTREVLRRLPNEAKARRPDLILISLGVNDCSHYPKRTTRHRVPLPVFKKNLPLIVKSAKVLAPHVILLTPSPIDESKTLPVPWGYYYTLYDEASYTEAILEIGSREKVPVIDVFDYWLQKVKNYKKLLYDGLHPNAKGHEEMYKYIKKELRRYKIL